MQLGRYSIGLGDRFAHQAKAQLHACQSAARQGVEVVPVWNKSNREHATIGSEPEEARRAADAAVRALGWQRPYHVDADHVGLDTVDRFLEACDFFTIDVAAFIGHAPSPKTISAFLDQHAELQRPLKIPGLDQPLLNTPAELSRVVGVYLEAVRAAGRVYRKIAAAKGAGTFITEVSMDETQQPQTPQELLVILVTLADERIPLQTIAPKFTGHFHKGVDYVGDVAHFEREFRGDVAVLAYAVSRYALPENLKLSVHSGSDKFSLYGPIRRVLTETGAGVHLKTAGTTWLEEIIGLAEAGGAGLDLAKDIYSEAVKRVEELCVPYAAVIDIDRGLLPPPETVRRWSSREFVSALRHDPRQPGFNPALRQLLHVGYKIAAQMKDRYLPLLEKHEDVVARNVTRNLFERHIVPLFLGDSRA